MSSFHAAHRHEVIVEALQSSGMVEVAALAVRLGVSTVTVRNDLDRLERQQLLRRIRGGAVAIRPARFERPMHVESQRFAAEKQRIAAVAASMIRDGETIILDAGSTTMAIACALSKQLSDVAVVTNAIDIALELERHPGVTVVVTGGTLRPRQLSLVAPFGTVLLKQINADAAFLSCAGIDPVKGFTNSNWAEAEIKQVMIAAASRVVFVADSGKLRHVGTALIAAVDAVDMLVTDAGAPPDILNELRGRGLQVVVA
jgi:DeoR/GlpR family transcriptional regulator of sugar metabolism